MRDIGLPLCSYVPWNLMYFQIKGFKIADNNNDLGLQNMALLNIQIDTGKF